MRSLGPTLLVFLALFVAGALPAAAQSEATVRARLSSTVAKRGSQVEIRLDVENADSVSEIALPAVKGLVLGPASGPSRSSRTVLIGSRRTETQRMSWAIPVRCVEVGTFTIPPVRLVVDGAAQETRPFELEVRGDQRAEEIGFFEVKTSADRVVDGQPFSVEVLFGWEFALRDQVNYASLDLPWLEELESTLELETPEFTGRRISVNLNGRDADVEELPRQDIDGTPYRLMRLKRNLLPTRSGTLSIGPSFFEFGYLVRTTSIFDRRTERRESYNLAAEAIPVEVVPLPEEGRPIGFTGAIGSLEAEASADLQDVDAGQSIKLTVSWTGPGNLEFFEAPDLTRVESFEGFRIYGNTPAEKSLDRRTEVYDLAPIDPGLTAIPPVPLWVYDPELGRYRSVESEPIPIRVRALEGAGLAGEEEVSYATDIQDLITDFGGEPDSGEAEATGPGEGWIPTTGVLAFVGWIALRRYVRRHGDPSSPIERRHRRARKVLARELAASAGASDDLRAFARYLAARTREEEAAWIGRDVAGWAAEPGNSNTLSDEDQEQLSAMLLRLERAAYAGAPVPENAELLALADRVKGLGT